MRHTRIQLRDDETRFAFVLVTDNEAWNRETLLHDPLRIGLRCDEKVLEVLVILMVLITLVAPHRYFLSVEHHDMKKGVQEKNRVRVHASIRTFRMCRSKRRFSRREITNTLLTSSNREERAVGVH